MFQTVRALAGEGGEVGGKALALLERWKQLVSIDFIVCNCVLGGLGQNCLNR